MYDVVIIGAGPIGLACAIECKKNRLNYLIIEKGVLTNSIFNYPVNMTFFSTSERLEIGDVPFISHGSKPTRTEALEYYRRVASSWALNIHLYEEVKEIFKKNNHFSIITSKGKYVSKKIVVATGFFDYFNKLDVEGEHLDKVLHYYKEAHPFINQKIAVVGGGNSGVDVALETYRKGAEVTLILNKSEIDSGVKYWVKPDIENRIKEGEIKCYFNSKVKKIFDDSILISTPEGTQEIENDFVLAMTGYHPELTFLNKLSIKVNNESMAPIINNETQESNIDGLFFAGVVCGGNNTSTWFIENSRIHAKNIINFICNNNE